MTRLFNDPATLHRGHAGRIPRCQLAIRRRGCPAAWCAPAETPPGKVAVVVGGGAGHYPAFCGVVGTGFADGAVVGNIFTSPSAREAASVARAAHGDAGVLLLTGNYAGDVMNFGLAVQQLRVRASTHGTCPSPTTSPAPHRRSRPSAGASPGTSPYSAAPARLPKRAPTSTTSSGSPPRPTTATRTLGVAFDGCTMPGADRPLFTVSPGHHGPGPGHPRRARGVQP